MFCTSISRTVGKFEGVLGAPTLTLEQECGGACVATAPPLDCPSVTSQGRARCPPIAAGPPQYESQAAVVVESRPVCPNGRSWLLRLEGREEDTQYEPGHVLAVEVEHEGDLLRGPYTVTRSTNARSIDVIYRVITGDDPGAPGDHRENGSLRKTAKFKSLAPGDPAKFGGSFHVPILRGIAPRAEHTVLIATGAGVGPMIGFVEQCVALWAAGEAAPTDRVSLYAGYREAGDVICGPELEDLVARSGGRFAWHACLSGPGAGGDGALAGRTTTAAPARIVSDLRGTPLQQVHWHMIGNGQMVQEWQAGLGAVGVPDERVTVEMYFGHKSEPSPAAIQQIAEGLAPLAKSK